MIHMELMLAGRPIDGEIQTVQGAVELNELENWEIALTSLSPLSCINQMTCLWIRVDSSDVYIHGLITRERIERRVSDEFVITLTLQAPMVLLQRQQINRVYPQGNYADTIKNWLGEFATRATLSGQWPEHSAFTTFAQTHWSLFQETLQKLKKFSSIQHEKNHWKMIIGDDFPEQETVELMSLPSSGLAIKNYGIFSREKIQGTLQQWRVHTNHPSLKLGQPVKLEDDKHYRIVKMDIECSAQRFRNTLWLEENWQPKLQEKSPTLQHHFATIANNELQMNYCFSDDSTVTEPARLLQPGSQHGQSVTQLFPTPGAMALVSYLQGDLQQPMVQGYVNLPSIKPHAHNIWSTSERYQVTMDDQSYLKFSSPSDTSTLTLNFSKDHPGIEIISHKGEIEWQSEGDWSHQSGNNTEITSDAFSVQAHTLRGYAEQDHNINCENHLSISTQQDSRWKSENSVNISANSSKVSVHNTFQLTGGTIRVTGKKWQSESLQSTGLQGNIRIQVGAQCIDISDQSLTINANNIRFNADLIEILQHASINP